jgi:hypothetical protein
MQIDVFIVFDPFKLHGQPIEATLNILILTDTVTNYSLLNFISVSSKLFETRLVILLQAFPCLFK